MEIRYYFAQAETSTTNGYGDGTYELRDTPIFDLDDASPIEALPAANLAERSASRVPYPIALQDYFRQYFPDPDDRLQEIPREEPQRLRALISSEWKATARKT